MFGIGNIYGFGFKGNEETEEHCHNTLHHLPCGKLCRICCNGKFDYFLLFTYSWFHNVICSYKRLNAWQYSHFNKEVNLPTALLASIANQIDEQITKEEPIEEQRHKSLW